MMDDADMYLMGWFGPGFVPPVHRFPDLLRGYAKIEGSRLVTLLIEARQYVADAGSDEDPETQQNACVLLSAIDSLLDGWRAKYR
jgi:hypothetical protein